MTNCDVLIIGAGAAGLMCAIEASKRGRRVILLDKANKVGKKILISGGGRCNFSNFHVHADNYLSHNLHFCKSALSRYQVWDFIALMKKHQLDYSEKTLGQLFCQQKSAAIVQMLTRECAHSVKIKLNTNIQSIQKNEYYDVKTSTGHYQSQSLVIATGGSSIPAMGASDFALQIAKQFSLNYFPFAPALVPFIFSSKLLNQFIKELAGTSVSVKISTLQQSFTESILFTHRGISGPAALQISSYWHEGQSVKLDLFPQSDALAWLQNQQHAHPLANLKTILAYHLPKKLAQILCREWLGNPVIKTLHLSDLKKLAHTLTHWSLTPSKTEGMRTAEVSLGGVDTNELSSKTFETKKEVGLYFIGESVDVTGHLGGYNFQWAWASGWCAGQYV